MGNKTKNRARLVLGCAAAVAGALTAAPRPAHAVNITWTGNGSTNDWTNSGNWSGGPPHPLNDAFIGTGFASGTIIDISSTGINSHIVNSLTINTTTGFTIRRANDSNLHYLGLDSGDLTRLNVSGTEEDHIFDVNVALGASGTWNVAGSNDLTVRGHVAQFEGVTAGLTKTGTGRLVLNATNGVFGYAPYTGSTTISAGWLRLKGLGGIGSGTVTVANNATLEFENHNVVADSTLRIQGTGVQGFPPLTFDDGALKNVSGFSKWDGPVVLLADASVNVVDGTLALNGGVSDGAGTYKLTKFGAGTLQLTAAGTFGGGTAVTSGLLSLSHSGALGSSGAITVSVIGGIGLSDGVTFARPFSVSGSGPGGLGAIRGDDEDNSFTGAITLTGNTVVGADSSFGTLRLRGPIGDGAGAFSLTKVGPGVLIVDDINTYGGGTTVAEGIFGVASNTALPAGTVTTVQNGARIEFAGAAGLVVNRELRLNGLGVGGAPGADTGALYSPAHNTNHWSGPITLQSESAVGVAAGSTLTLFGAVTSASPAARLVKVGEGTVVLSNAANAFSELIVNKGTARAAAATSLSGPVTVNAGGTLETGVGVSYAQPLKLNGAGASAATGALHSPSGTNSWTGPITLQSASTISVAAGSLAIGGGITGEFELTKSGPGVLLLGGVNDYADTRVAAGVLSLETGTAAPASSVIRVSPGATLRLASGVATPASVAAEIDGPGVAPDFAALLGSAGLNSVFAGPVALKGPTAIGVAAGGQLALPGVISAAAPDIPLVKNGGGTLVLTNVGNTYSGGTVINGGTLAVSSNAQLGAGSVSVNNGSKLHFTSSSTTGRTFNLNTGAIQVSDGATVTYNGATVSGGFLRGPGTHAIGSGSTFGGVTSLPGAAIVQGGAATLTNFTNGGNVTNATAPLTWDGGQNSGSGVLTVNNTVNTTAFANYGVIRVNAGGILSNSANPLVSGGGSEITVNPGGLVQLNGATLDLRDALLVNNGAIAGGTLNIHYGSLAAGTGDFPTIALHPGGAFTPGVSLGNIPAPGPLSTGTIAPLDPDQTASAAVDLHADTTASVNAAHNSLTLTGPVLGPGRVLTKAGAGALAIASIHAGGLKIEQGSVRILPGGGGEPPSVLDSLTLAGAPGAWAVTLDLSDNDLVVRLGDPATVRDQARSGRAGGAWTGQGLASSAAASDARRITALAVVPNDAGDGKPLFETFHGEPVDSKAVLVMYTYNGDTDLSGVVDGDDYLRADRGFLAGGAAGWLTGDFNYDDRVNVSDYFLLDQAHAMQQGPLGASPPPALAAVVPEPAGLAAAALLGTAALNRRRKRPAPQGALCKPIANMLLQPC